MKTKRNNRIDGCVTGLLAVFLLAYSVFHHYTDPVHYAWGLSPYLFPAILSAVLLLLAAVLFRKPEPKPAETVPEAIPTKPGNRPNEAENETKQRIDGSGEAKR